MRCSSLTVDKPRAEFAIDQQVDGRFCIVFKTQGTLDAHPRAIATIDKDLPNLFAAETRLLYFTNTNKYWQYETYKFLKEFDPYKGHTFRDIIINVGLTELNSSNLRNYVYEYMISSAGNGWDVNKTYKLKSKSMMQMWFWGHLMQYRHYCNNLLLEEFYAESRKALDSIVTMYGNRVQDP